MAGTVAKGVAVQSAIMLLSIIVPEVAELAFARLVGGAAVSETLVASVEVKAAATEMKAATSAEVKVATSEANQSVQTASKVNNVADNTYSRVTPRKGTLAKVKDKQPKDASGQMLDPNTGQPLGKRVDLGHKPGNEWKTRKEMHKAKGSTREEVLEAENDPDLYQYEDRSNNRSHKYEKKKN